MTKSELIEKLATRQSQLSAKEVESAIKEMLEQMATTLEGGDRIEIRGFGSFLFTIVHRVLAVIQKLVPQLNWKANTYRTLSLAKNCANVSMRLIID